MHIQPIHKIFTPKINFLRKFSKPQKFQSLKLLETIWYSSAGPQACHKTNYHQSKAFNCMNSIFLTIRVILYMCIKFLSNNLQLYGGWFFYKAMYIQQLAKQLLIMVPTYLLLASQLCDCLSEKQHMQVPPLILHGHLHLVVYKIY